MILPPPHLVAHAGRLAAVTCVLALVLAARADVVGFTGQPPHVKARVLRLREGAIEVELPDAQVSKPMEQVEYLQITGWQLFNLAEKQFRDGNARQAAISYEAVLKDLADPRSAARDARSPVSAELDRVLLARCRLVRAYDALGRFDKAVEVYLAIVEGEEGVAHVESARPQKLPAEGSPALESAHALLAAAVQRHATEPLGDALARWRETLPQPETHQVPTSAPAGVMDEHARGIQVVTREIQRLVEAGDEAGAIERIRPLQQDATGIARADLFYWQGRALLARSRRGSGEAAEADARRAGLAFMRVPIHFPGHPRAAECLYMAGELCASGGLGVQASQLWSELIGNYPEASPWAKQARASLAKVAPASAPAG